MPSSRDKADDTANVGEEEQDNEDVQHEFVPVLLASHLHDALLCAEGRRIGQVYILLCAVYQVALVFELAVCVDHDAVGLNGHALNPIDLVSLVVQVLNAVQQAFTVAVSQSFIRTLAKQTVRCEPACVFVTVV